jgi:hypothetical protein
MTGSQFRFFSFLLILLGLGTGGLLFWVVADEGQLQRVRQWVRPAAASQPSTPPTSNPSDSSWPTASSGGEIILRLEREKSLLQAELDRTRAELEQTQAELSELKRPMEKDVVSSSLNAELLPGEVLVTGGYQTADGAVHFTFVEPTAPVGANGRDQVTFATRQIALDPKLVEELGINSLETAAGNVLQHGEAWAGEDYRQFIEEVKQHPGTMVLTSPAITTRLEQDATVEVGALKLDLSATNGPTGGLNVQLRVEMPRDFESGVTPLEP